MEWLTYLLKVTACTVLFFGFYVVVLRKLTFFKINRFYLLATLLLSFVIPALQFEVKREIAVAEAVETAIPANVPELNPKNVTPQLIQPVTLEYDQKAEAKMDWTGLISYVYTGIASLLLLSCLWRLFSLLRHTKGSVKNKEGLKLVPKTKGFTNCSFFSYVFIDADKLSDVDFAVLLKHEQVHARQYHSVDKIILMVFKSLLWFNPIVYLYDKALEQVHEYEADEITSADFGNQAYASLLLKLAVSKSDIPLIHNFVKSPVKDRIKMLFNQKTASMKKLSYLLALPITIGLLWMFSIQFVYAGKQILSRDKELSNKKGFIGVGQSLLDDTVNVAKAFRKKYATNIKKGDAILGKYIKAKFLGFRDSRHGVLGDISYNNKIYSFEAILNLGKLSHVKIGDSLKLKINGFSCPEPYNQLLLWTNKISTADGHLLYKKSIKGEPFLYGMNGLRFTFSKVASVDKDGKHLKRIILNNKNYTIELDVTGENFVNDKIEVGDEVSVEFVGVKLIRPNTYFSNQIVELHSRQNKYSLKAKMLYSKYHKDIRKGIIAASTKAVIPISPRIISFSKITGNAKQKVSIMENAEIDINNNKLKAKYVELDEINGTMVAKNASFTNSKDNYRLESNLITFNLKKGGFSFDSGNGEMKTFNDLDELMRSALRTPIDDPKLQYSAQDSVKMSRDKSVVSLFGNAKMIYKDVVLSGDKIVYNKHNNSVMVHKATMSGENKVIKADSLFFNLRTEKAKLYGAGFNR